MRTANSRLMRRVWVATAAAKATLSMPRAYPEGNKMLS